MSFPPGFIVIDKPSGVTSFSMVSLVRRLTGVRRVGHAGTLDPLASGVLPVAIGQATRLIEYLDDATKTYVARVRFGIATDTYDAEGQVVATADASAVTSARIEAGLRAFEGEIEQTPPAFSALKVAGKPLYRYAREGAQIAAAPRRVRIHRADLIGFEHETAKIEVECGKGTYIRSLAHDLGQRLGCGAHLTALRRTASGGFSLEDAQTPDELAAATADGNLEGLLLAPDRAVERRRAAIVAPERARDVLSGRDVTLVTPSSGSTVEAPAICRAYATDGRFLGVLSHRGHGLWHPTKIVADPPSAPDLANFP